MILLCLAVTTTPANERAFSSTTASQPNSEFKEEAVWTCSCDIPAKVEAIINYSVPFSKKSS